MRRAAFISALRSVRWTFVSPAVWVLFWTPLGLHVPHLFARAHAQPRFVGERGEPGTAPGEFLRVAGLAVSSGDTLCVADFLLSRVTLFDAAGQALLVWGTSGSEPGQLRLPSGMQIDAASHVYIADSENHRVQRFQLDGTFVQAFGDSGSGPGQFSFPAGLALTGDRQLYIADSGNRRVQHIDWSGDPPVYVRSIGDASRLASPSGVVLDAAGFVYVVDLGNHGVHRFSPAGMWLKTWGGEGTGPGQLQGPFDAVIDGADLHVTDSLNGRVQVFDLEGAFRFTWPEGGIPSPTRLALGPGRRLFVSAPLSSRVLVYELDPVPVESASWTQVKGVFR